MFSVDLMYQINGFVQEEHSKNLKYHTTEYLMAYKNIMKDNACVFVN